MKKVLILTRFRGEYEPRRLARAVVAKRTRAHDLFEKN
jgi:hypothetical protein